MSQALGYRIGRGQQHRAYMGESEKGHSIMLILYSLHLTQTLRLMIVYPCYRRSLQCPEVSLSFFSIVPSSVLSKCSRPRPGPICPIPHPLPSLSLPHKALSLSCWVGHISLQSGLTVSLAQAYFLELRVERRRCLGKTSFSFHFHPATRPLPTKL